MKYSKNEVWNVFTNDARKTLPPLGRPLLNHMDLYPIDTKVSSSLQAVGLFVVA